MSETQVVPLRSIAALDTEKVTDAKDASKPYVGLEHIPTGGAKVSGLGVAGDSTSTNSVFTAGDVLLGKLRPRLRKCIRVDFDGYCSTDILVLRPVPPADPVFVGYVCQSEQVFTEAIRTEEGTKMPRTSWRDIANVPILLPEAPKQRRIAEILSTVDEAIEHTAALIAKTQQIKTGLMHDLFTRGVTPDGRLRPPRDQAPELYKQSPLGWIPREWRVAKLEESVSSRPNAIVDGPFGSNLKTIHYRDEGIPVIQSGYVTSGRFTAAHYHYVTREHFSTQKRSRVDAGDIVMAKIGAQAGTCAVLPPNHPAGILAGNSLKITVDGPDLLRDWLLQYLHFNYDTAVLQSVRTETAQPAISLGRLRKLLIPIPCLAEQSTGEGSLRALEVDQSALGDELRNLRLLKAGLMNRLFCGKGI